MKQILLACTLLIAGSVGYASPDNAKPLPKHSANTYQIQEIPHAELDEHEPINKVSKERLFITCETLCCEMSQSAIAQNNALLNFQLGNCGKNTTSQGDYESCVDAVFYSYQSTATAIYAGYVACMVLVGAG